MAFDHAKFLARFVEERSQWRNLEVVFEVFRSLEAMVKVLEEERQRQRGKDTANNRKDQVEQLVRIHRINGEVGFGDCANV